MSLRFEGDVTVWMGVVLGLIIAVALWTTYRREVRRNRDRWTWVPPLLRGMAGVMIILMLTGPVLRGKVQIGDLSHVLVYVDQSRSMALVDKSMHPARKLLNAARLGWVTPELLDSSSYELAERLSSFEQHQLAVAQILDDLQSNDATPDPSLLERLNQVSASMHNALQVDRSQLPDNMPDNNMPDNNMPDNMPDNNMPFAMFSQWQSAAKHLSEDRNQDRVSIVDRAQACDRLCQRVNQWRVETQSTFAETTAATIAAGPGKLASAVSKFDQLSRWQRVESILLQEDHALLEQLTEKHHVELRTLAGTDDRQQVSRPLWQPRGSRSLPASLAPAAPESPATDLVTEIENRLAEHGSRTKAAVVLFSDGQHNQSRASSPLHLARLLRNRGVPIFCVGVGAVDPPRDLAVLAVQTPESVFADDRVKGEILVKDNMPTGKPLHIKIQVDQQVVWQKRLSTSGENARSIEFDFPIKELVEDRLARAVTASDVVSLPLPLYVSIEPVEGEVRDDNNGHQSHVRAITRRRRVLLIDSRPRWELRYLRNLLARDEHWEINDIILPSDGGGGWRLPRGAGLHEFPGTRDALLAYDLIVLGEVPAAVLQSVECDWLREFVAARGGGLVLMDGRRDKLRSLTDTSLNAVLPIRWTGNHADGRQPTHLRLTAVGQHTTALAFEGQSAESARRWTELPPPRWLAPVETLPGCETLVEAMVAGQPHPAIALRRFGAGQVVYLAFDETWRWRYEVADFYHQRFWNQLAGYVMEPPYAVHGKFVSIDTGGFSYQKGEQAEFRVRLRDAQGQPLVPDQAAARLYRKQQLVATIPLTADGNAGGMLRGRTPRLEPGIYQVGVAADGVPVSGLEVRAEFAVQGESTGEMNVLYCDEELLREMSRLSGGQYLREENVGRLSALLAPYSEGRMEEREWVLWRSWLWFLPLVGLFTCEWIVRKRIGLM